MMRVLCKECGLRLGHGGHLLEDDLWAAADPYRAEALIVCGRPPPAVEHGRSDACGAAATAEMTPPPLLAIG